MYEDETRQISVTPANLEGNNQRWREHVAEVAGPTTAEADEDDQDGPDLEAFAEMGDQLEAATESVVELEELLAAACARETKMLAELAQLRGQRDAVLALPDQLPVFVRAAARGADPLAVSCRDCRAFPQDTCQVEGGPRTTMDGVVATTRRRRPPHDTRVWDARWEAIAAAVAEQLREAMEADRG